MSAVTLLHPTGGFSWTQFSVHPSTVVGIAALGALYAWRAGKGRGDRAATAALGDARAAVPAALPARPSPSAGQKLAFASGLVALFLALNGPIHDLSDSYLFSAHMVQHLVLTMLVTPLLIAGTPGWMLRPALRYPAVAAVARRVTTGPAAFVIFNLTLVAWHLPPMYNAALLHHPVHIVQHLCFLVASTLMWWPLMSPLPELPRLSYPQQMLYAFLITLPMTLVSVLITYADTTLYPFYASAPRVWGLSPHDDQLLGGLIMWIPGGLIFIGVLTVVFFKWAASGEDDVASAQVVERTA